MKILGTMIPAGTWIWKKMESIPMMDSLRTLASQYAYILYLNKRDTLRNEGDTSLASRWSKYNMYLATYLNRSREKCSTSLRGHRCKQMYD